MKKLLTLAAAALLASSVANAANFYMAGPANAIQGLEGDVAAWSQNDPNGKFEKVGNGLFQWKGNKLSSQFKITTPEWTMNWGLENQTIAKESIKKFYKDNSEITVSGEIENPLVLVTKGESDDNYDNEIYVYVTQWGYSIPESGYQYFIFDNSKKNWNAVSVHFWGDQNTQWPGIPMLKMTIDEKEYYVLRIADSVKINGFMFVNAYDRNDKSTEIKNVDFDLTKVSIYDGTSTQTVGGTTEEPTNPDTPWELGDENYNYFYYDNSVSNWNKVCFYAYGNSGDISETGKFPGKETQEFDFDGKKLNVYRLPKTTTIKGAIFNNGYGDDQANLKQQAETIYDNYNVVRQAGNTVKEGSVYTTTSVGEISADGKFTEYTLDPDPKKTYINASDLGITDASKIYFIFDATNRTWENVYCHAWSENKGDLLGTLNNNTKWPGEKMTKIDGTQYYMVTLGSEYTKDDIKGFIIHSNTEDDGRIDVEDASDINFGTFPVFKSSHLPEAYLAFPSDAIITNNNYDGCFTQNEGVIYHDSQIAYHPNVENAKSFELCVAPSVQGNAFDFLANSELNDNISVSVKPLFPAEEYTFIKADENGKPMYEKDENGIWHPVYEEESSYKDPTVANFEYDGENRVFNSSIRTDIAGNYEVTVKVDAYACNLVPFEKTFKVNIKPTIDALGLHFSAVHDNKNYKGGCGLTEDGKLMTNLTEFSDEALKKVDIKTGNHVPTRSLEIWYKLVDAKKNAPRKAEADTNDLAADGYKKVNGLVDLTDVKNGTKNLSLVINQNGSTSGNIDFEGDSDTVTAVEEIATEVVDAPARYFTLQGLEVSQLVPGIYIQVKGNVSTKIVVK